MSEKVIYAKLLSVAHDVGAVGKDGRNDNQNYNYRRLEDVINAVHRAFTANGVMITSEVIDHRREEKSSKTGGILNYSILTMRFTFYAKEDGSSVQSITVGEGMDSGDKASNKAMSAALKYALGQTLMIPFEVIDSELESHETESDEKILSDWAMAIDGASTKEDLEKVGKELAKSSVMPRIKTKLREEYKKQMESLK